MSDTIRGKLKNISIAKEGKGKRGAWTLRKLHVDDEKYSTFENLKASIGSIVEFEAEQNENGFWDIVKETFVVVKEATTAESNETKKANAESESGRQSSIESQVTLKASVDLVAAVLGGQGGSIEDVLKYIPKAYAVLSGCLRSQAVPSAAKATPAKKPAPKKPVEAEDENQDESEEEQAPDY